MRSSVSIVLLHELNVVLCLLFDDGTLALRLRLRLINDIHWLGRPLKDQIAALQAAFLHPGHLLHDLIIEACHFLRLDGELLTGILRRSGFCGIPALLQRYICQVFVASFE